MSRLIGRDSLFLFENACQSDPIIVRGVDPILKLQVLMSELSVRCGQPGCWDDLKYFFSLPYARNKTPYLLLFVSRPGLTAQTVTSQDLVAALLTNEYRLRRIHTRIFITDDGIGRRTLIAPPALRNQIALLASYSLMLRGAQISSLTYQDDSASLEFQDRFPVTAKGGYRRWATQQRESFAYLPLQSTFEATMATLGKRTRSHMRYYRRRAERDLGATFVSHVNIGRTEFQQFNRLCSFAVTDEVSDIRYNALSNSPNSFLSGIRDKDGNWLSIAGGQKNHGAIEVYWQMNLASRPAYSLSTVLRSFLIEYEISCGTKKFLIEGGTPHPMRFSFAREIVSDVIVRRTSVYANLVTLAAKYIFPYLFPKNFVAQLLSCRELQWGSLLSVGRTLSYRDTRANLDNGTRSRKFA